MRCRTMFEQTRLLSRPNVRTCFRIHIKWFGDKIVGYQWSQAVRRLFASRFVDLRRLRHFRATIILLDKLELQNAVPAMPFIEENIEQIGWTVWFYKDKCKYLFNTITKSTRNVDINNFADKSVTPMNSINYISLGCLSNLCCDCIYIILYYTFCNEYTC